MKDMKKIYRLSIKDKHHIIQRITAFMEEHKEIVFAYCYGSFTGDIPFHDIDIGVYLEGITKEEASSYSLNSSLTYVL